MTPHPESTRTAGALALAEISEIAARGNTGPTGEYWQTVLADMRALVSAHGAVTAERNCEAAERRHLWEMYRALETERDALKHANSNLCASIDVLHSEVARLRAALERIGRAEYAASGNPCGCDDAANSALLGPDLGQSMEGGAK